MVPPSLGPAIGINLKMNMKMKTKTKTKMKMETRMKTTLDWRLLRKLYAIHSPSGMERKMIKFLAGYLKTIPGVELGKDHYGNLYAWKGEAESYPCIVSHLDQVQQSHPKDFMPVETGDIIFGYSPGRHEFCGLGADDKNGIIIVLEALKKYACIKAVFFKEEEIGCRGSSECDMEFFKDCRFVIQCDRRGNGDFITHIGGLNLCSEKFIQDVDPEKWGYHEESGMMTDVETQKENGLGISAVNLSCGYYNPHTDEEITVKRDLEKCWRMVRHIIEDCRDSYPHEADGYGCYGMYDAWEIEEEIYSILQEDPDLTAVDIYEMYQTNFPALSLNDLEHIVEDYRLFYGEDGGIQTSGYEKRRETDDFEC